MLNSKSAIRNIYIPQERLYKLSKKAIQASSSKVNHIFFLLYTLTREYFLPLSFCSTARAKRKVDFPPEFHCLRGKSRSKCAGERASAALFLACTCIPIYRNGEKGRKRIERERKRERKREHVRARRARP